MSMLGNNLGTFEEKQKGQLFDFQIIALSRSTRSQYITVKIKENIIKKYKENQIFS